MNNDTTGGFELYLWPAGRTVMSVNAVDFPFEVIWLCSLMTILHSSRLCSLTWNPIHIYIIQPPEYIRHFSTLMYTSPKAPPLDSQKETPHFPQSQHRNCCWGRGISRKISSRYIQLHDRPIPFRPVMPSSSLQT